MGNVWSAQRAPYPSRKRWRRCRFTPLTVRTNVSDRKLCLLAMFGALAKINSIVMSWTGFYNSLSVYFYSDIQVQTKDSATNGVTSLAFRRLPSYCDARLRNQASPAVFPEYKKASYLNDQQNKIHAPCTSCFYSWVTTITKYRLQTIVSLVQIKKPVAVRKS